MNNIGTIIILVLGLILVAAIFIGVLYVRNKVREFSRYAFGTDSLMEGLKKTEMEYENTPKSVSGATKLYLPQIMKDFPEFHLEEMRERAENVLRSYLYSIDRESSSHLTEGTDELRAELDTEIDKYHKMAEQNAQIAESLVITIQVLTAVKNDLQGRLDELI